MFKNVLNAWAHSSHRLQRRGYPALGLRGVFDELNVAMSNIQDENRYYNQQMSEKYLLRSGVNAFLTAGEDKWLKEHGPIKVGYQDNYLAFCARDQKTGKLTGALKNYLEYASDCLENAHIDFKAKGYPTSEATMEALKKGEVDCIFPVNLRSYDGESRGMVMIPPNDFIPLFERNGRIGEVDKYVWNEAARQVVRWRDMYGITIPVSVNLSRVDVFDPTLEETLDGILQFNGLDHDALKLEVTESAYTENSDQVIK